GTGAAGPFETLLQTDATSCSIEVTQTAVRYYAVRSVSGSLESSFSAPAANGHVSMSAEAPPSGYTLRASNGEVELVLPAGAYATTTTVTVEEDEDASLPPSLLSLAGVYRIEPSGSLSVPATLKVRCEVSVAHFQIADTLLAAAELMTRNQVTGTWVVGSADAHISGGWLEGTVTHFSYWSGATIQPHGTTPAKTSYCSGICHNLIAAPGSPQVIPNRDPVVCFFCHGNALSTDPPAGASGPNIEALFIECDDQVFNPSTQSRHPAATTTANWMACTDCHDPHRDPSASPDLLRAYDAVTGRAVRGGDDFCWACHGTRKSARIDAAVPGYWTRTGGDKKTAWTGNAHATSITATGTLGSACMACHAEHGSNYTSLIATSIAGQPVGGNDKTVCYACHTAAVEWKYPGQATYDGSAHGATACQGCHDPHGKPGTEVLLAESEEEGCFACHDGSIGGVPDIRSEITKTLPNPISWQRNDVWPDATASGMLRTRVGDIDGDGDQDFATVWQDDTIRWHENTAGDASAWSTVLIGTFPAAATIRSLDVGDLEGDGDMDLVVAGKDDSGSPRNGYVKVYANTAGDGSVWAERDVRTYNGAYSFYGHVSAAFGDFDDDGDLDVASGWWTTDVRWHENTAGDGTAWGDVPVVASSTYQSYRVAVGDVTGDGSPDIINGRRNGGVLVYRNDNDATSWTYVGNASVAGDVHDIAIGDLDGDTDNDIVATGWSDYVRVKLNTAGNGTVWSTTNLPMYWGLANVGLEIADLDQDNDMDVLASTGVAIYQYVNVLGDASSWDGAYAFLAGNPDYAAYNHVAAADFDGDGDEDLSFGGSLSGTGRKAFWLENLGILPPTSGAHPTTAYSARHSVDESIGAVGATNRHAECVDCHASHEAEPGVHAMGDSNLAGALEGAFGLFVQYSGTPWTQPTYWDDFSGPIPVAEEYELCFRCHSSYTTGYTGGDKALEFNPDNAAMHPIVRRGKNLGIWDSAFTLGTPWNPTAGDDPDYGLSSPRMTCSDCHASDDPASPRGPHGSIYPHLLRSKASTDALELGGGQNDLCVICHDNWTYNTSDSDFGPPLPVPPGYSSRIYHRHFVAWGAYCLECHEEHGTNTPHMIRAADYVHEVDGGVWEDYSMCSVSCHGVAPEPYTNIY
ncbi:MAG: FG-GAP-like repeat-containing protein, partial [Coriobacteriia bacterium]|nr:FG-GAP-like repeat-containing protein [Coriobacteriia bacterium]